MSVTGPGEMKALTETNMYFCHTPPAPQTLVNKSIEPLNIFYARAQPECMPSLQMALQGFASVVMTALSHSAPCCSRQAGSRQPDKSRWIDHRTSVSYFPTTTPSHFRISMHCRTLMPDLMEAFSRLTSLFMEAAACFHGNVLCRRCA
jgi:hypothetical protein